MALLFGASRRDQVHLLSTLQSLNPASVAGLAAALSWSERKTEKVVREIASARGSIVAYDPVRRMVSIRRPTASTTVSASISGGVAGPVPPIPPAPSPTAPASAVDRSTPLGTARHCPNCHVALLSTASGDAAVCPRCGELSTRRSSPPTAAGRVTGPTPGLTSPPVPVESGRTVVHAHDRRSQELFAAWVTSRPIPCPRCRTSLRHRGVGEYGCPSCGHRVVFETSLGRLGPNRDDTPPAN